MGSLEDHKDFGALYPQFWGLELPLLTRYILEACRRLRSSSSSSLIVSRTRLSTIGDQAFPVAAACHVCTFRSCLPVATQNPPV